MSKTILFVIFINIVISAAISGFIYTKLSAKPSRNDLITEFYEIENAVHVSPHSLRKSLDKGEQNYTIVDLRSQEEYEKEHIISAINIPAYSDPDTSAYQEVDRIATAFKELPKDKDIVVYCYSTPCMTGRKVGQMLVEYGIFVKHLGIGWNEWRFHWNLWNHEHEWEQTNVSDYVGKGKEPGNPKVKGRDIVTPCEEDNNFGC